MLPKIIVSDAVAPGTVMLVGNVKENEVRTEDEFWGTLGEKIICASELRFDRRAERKEG